MDLSMIGSVASITVICMLVAQIFKATALDNKWIPGLCGVVGAILGVIGYHVMPTYPAQDVLTAIAVGIVSGLAATGAHQTFKQMACTSK